MLATIVLAVSSDEMKQCPSNSIGTSPPNCTCTGKNQDYSVDLNACFHYCPENSSGHYWPDCRCDNQNEFFDKKGFQCIACNPDDPLAIDIYTKKCRTCAGKSVGSYPNCSCPGDSGFNLQSNWCYSCPSGTNGKWPDCVCDDGSAFDKISGSCKSCPPNATGQIPNCKCADPLVYTKETNLCVECPEDAVGNFPKCQCTNNAWFSVNYGRCYDIKCPDDSTGKLCFLFFSISQ